jgi:transcriptional regulator with XRE-family HTH domain
MGPYTARPIAVEAPRFQQNFNAALDTSSYGVRSLARAAGIDKDTVSAWRTGARTTIRFDAVEKAAPYLGVSAEALLDLPPPSLLSAKATPPASTPTPERDLVRELAALADELQAMNRRTAPALVDILRKAERIASDARSLVNPRDSA